MIEVLMSIAFVLYFVAFFIARKGGKHFMMHIPVAVFAFALDMWGTWLMIISDLDISGWVPLVHTGLTVFAISLFFVQGTLGILKKRKWHIWFAKNVFLPAWVVSYLSGFLFLI